MESLKGSLTEFTVFKYVQVHRNQGLICFLYVAKDVPAEASVSERSDAFETGLSPHTHTFRRMEQTKHRDITESNIQADAAKKTSKENSEEIYFCPTAGVIMTKHGLL